jgi:hypothetical protein
MKMQVCLIQVLNDSCFLEGGWERSVGVDVSRLCDFLVGQLTMRLL